MSDTASGITEAERRRANGVTSLLRAFARGLEPAEAEKLHGQLATGEVGFGEGDLIVPRNFAVDLANADDPVVVWLAGTGGWQQRLLATIANDRPRRLRWSAQHHFLYVLAA